MHPVFPSNKFLFLFFALFSGVIYAQKDTTKQKIETQKLIIVKPYSPTVSDAVKEKQIPTMPDSTVFKKRKVDYTIFHVPVASTFNPKKGNAAGVTKQRLPRLYDNYAALGIGNYLNVLAEFYSTIHVSNQQDLKIGIEHHSSQGGIKDAVLDDTYYDTRLDLGFTSEEKNLIWTAKLGARHRLYNWYGLFDNPFSENQLAKIDPAHNYLGFYAGGNIEMKHGAFHGISIDFHHFGDDFDHSENHIEFEPRFSFEINQKTVIDLELSGSYLSGTFNKDTDEWTYGYLDFGVLPSITIVRDKLTLNLGAQFVFASDKQNDEQDSQFFVYPKVKASYRVAGDYFILYAGADGQYKQNPYAAITKQNPFVSPEILIAPTNKQYELYIGAKGKFTEKLSYDLRGGYTSEEAKPLFVQNPSTSGFSSSLEPYQYNNSFTLVYDDVKNVSLHGNLGYTASEKLNLELGATYHGYTTDKQDEAWNLPELKVSFNGDYQLDQKWSFGTNVFYVGERKDRFTDAFSGTTKKISLDGFVDANLHVNYQVTDQFGVFLRGNNLLGDNYERWFHYPVQGIQGMIGASYQF